MKTSISAVVLTRNEEENIARCLNSVAFCDEIIVIDDNSTDQTINIAHKCGAKVFINALEGDFSRQHKFGLEKAVNNWVLFVDADEKVTQKLKREIIQSVENLNQRYVAFEIPRRDILWGKMLKHGESGSINILRLARKDAGLWVRRVHEVWRINGEVGRLENYLLHYPHQSIYSFIEHINRWSGMHAEVNHGDGKRSSIVKIVFWPILKFIRNYLIKLGFLDGMPGFITAVMMSIHSFLSWSKQWESQK